MSGDKVKDASFQLRKSLSGEGAEVISSQPWLWEMDRWIELVFALLTRIAPLREADVRLLSERLSDLDLLDITDLAELEPESDAPTKIRISELMMESGMSRDDAQLAITTIVEAAKGLQSNHDGKVQRYLRAYGERMLSEIGENFEFTQVDQEVIAEAFTYWLQNVLNMPLSLVDASVRRYSNRYGFTPQDLIRAADEMDMSLALVDDLAQAETSTKKEVDAPREAERVQSPE